MTEFIKNIQKYIDTIDICKVKMPTQKIFAVLTHDTKTNKYTIILNVNKKTIKQQCNSIIHELLHYHNGDLIIKNKNISLIEQHIHKLEKYYRKHIPNNIKTYIIHKIKQSNIYDAKTGKKLPCRQ